MAGILRLARVRAWKRGALACGLVYVVVALGAFSVYARLRPVAVDGALEALRVAWRVGDTDAIARLYADPNRSWQRQQL